MDSPISQLPDVGALDPAALVPIVQGGVTSKVPALQFSGIAQFQQADAGAVVRNQQARMREGVVRVTDFGVIGAGNDLAVVQLAVNACKNGRTLDFGNLTYDFGTVANAAWAVLIDSPIGMKMIGNGAQIHCTCTTGRASAFAVKNPQTFSSDGLEFSQPGYLIGSTSGTSNSANGTYGFMLFASAPFTAASPCGNVTINGAARDCAGFVIADGTTQTGAVSPVMYAMKNVTVNGVCERVYYGASSIYGATDFNANLVCRDVRRGFVSYGQNRAKVDLTLECSVGFVGSNAFVELACEGSSVGDVKDIDIRVRVTGCEAHSNIVNFYHQQASGTAGVIGNVKARVTLDNLTTAGKDGSVGSSNVFAFMHENPATGLPFSSTTRVTSNLDIDCDILGTISGKTISLATVPATQPPISLGRGVTDGLTDFNMWVYFKVLRGAKSLPFTPTVFGRTSAGAGTYSTQKGYISVVDGVASYTATMIWTAHTGTGALYANQFPVKALPSATIGNPAVNIVASGFGAAGTTIGGLVTGQGDEVTLYAIDTTAHGVATPSVPASGSLYISGTFPMYQ